MRSNRTGVELQLLGPLEVRRDDMPVPLGGRRARAILADLALHAGAVVSVDRLVDDVWGESAPTSGTHVLEVHVSKLRQALAPDRDVVATRAPGYALELDPAQIDVHRFTQLVAEGRAALQHADAADAVVLLREARSLWRGPALADFAYEPFAQGEIARLEELRQQCIEECIEAELALGRHDALVGELEALVVAAPLRERLRAQQMLALYRAGRQADALAAYQAARASLDELLGVEPGPELRALQAAILRHDDSLGLRPSAGAVAPAPRRKLAAILAAHARDAGKLDPEALHDVLERYVDVVAIVVRRHGGAVAETAGGTVLATFGLEGAQEDDALRAARAGLELQAALAERPLPVGIGIEYGDVVAARGRRLVTGVAVGLARSLAAAAPAGEVVVGEGAAHTIAHAAVLEPVDAMDAMRLRELVRSAPAFGRRFDAPFVGRLRELDVLRTALADAVTSGRARHVLVAGPAGIGKSRLVAELAREPAVTALSGGCLPYGEGITYWPLQTVVPEREVAEIVAAPSAGEIALAFRRWCERRAAERPLLLVLDDLQWAEPGFLDLAAHVADLAVGPILVVAIAREELLEARPDLFADARLLLEPLGPLDAETLAGALARDTAVSVDRRAQCTAASEGNPLFLEQLLAAASDDGVPVAYRGLPRSIEALVSARVDRLGPGERVVLECAAVVGDAATAPELLSLLDAGAAGNLGRHLESLRRRGFLRAGDDGRWDFRHGLIRDVVYRATSKRERAAVHERFADVLGEAPRLDELAGYHLERAYRLRSELGELDRGTRQLAYDAGVRLGAAGIRAWKRVDVPAAVNLLERATGLLPEGNANRRGLMCELGVALVAAGRPDDAARTLEQAVDLSRAARDGQLVLRGRVELAYERLLRDPTRGAGELLDVAGTAIPTFETLGDDRALGRSWLLVGFVHGGVHGRHSSWAGAAERALVHYRRSGWPSATCVGQLAAALYFGPAPVESALARCSRLLDDDVSVASRAHLVTFLGGLEAMRGRFDEARRLTDAGADAYRALRQEHVAAIFFAAVRGAAEVLAGELEAAAAVFEEACERLRALEDASHLCTRAAELADVRYRQGRLDDADRWARVAESAAAADDLSAQPLWRAVRAKLLACGGAAAEAEAAAREAVALAARTEALNRRGQVLADLAEVLELVAGRGAGAAAAAEAVALFEAKGNLVAAGAARALAGDPALA